MSKCRSAYEYERKLSVFFAVLSISNLIAIYENPAKTIPGKDEGFNDQFADIVVEYAPGFYQQSLSLPLQLVELTLGKDEARATQKDPSNDQEDKSTLKPEEVEDPTIDIGQQTHVPDGDYKLSTERYLNT